MLLSVPNSFQDLDVFVQRFLLMNKRLAASLLVGMATFVGAPCLIYAADNPASAEKSKLIEPVAKPAIAKPSDALAPKSKDTKQADVKSPDTKEADSKPVSGKPVEAKTVEARADSVQTPSGRMINDLKVMPGALTVPKGSSGPASGAPAVAADPLEEKVRGLLQEKLGKDGEVVLRVSPDTPLAKPETAAAAKGRAASTRTEGPTHETAASKDLPEAVKMPSPHGNNIVSSQHQPWDWSGPRGPQAWGRLDPAYVSCSSGKMQSPPSMAQEQLISSAGPALPQLNWQMQGFHWSRQGPLWTANLDAGSRSIFRGESFVLEAIQFRVPGEPFVGKKAPAASVHLIHRQANRLLIIAVPIEIDDQSPRNPAIASLLRRFPFEPTEVLSWAGLQLDPQALLPDTMQSALLFHGSLSYPPCTESVLWLLAQRPLSLPKAQWTELSRLIGEGARPLQALNGRPVLRLFAKHAGS